MAVSAEAYNKELEKQGKLNEQTKTIEFKDPDIKRIIEDFAKATEISKKQDMMELKFMEQIII